MSKGKVHTDDNPHLRVLERELDHHHESLPFWHREKKNARFRLLCAFDSLHPSVTSSLLNGRPSGVQRWHDTEAGVVTAMQWVDACYKGHDEFAIDEHALNDAGEFLHHSMKYANVVDFFMMHSRGQVLADADLSTKRIRFRFPTVSHGRLSSEGFNNNVAVLNHIQSEMQGPDMEHVVSGALSQVAPVRVDRDGIRVRIVDPLSAMSSEMRRIAKETLPSRAFQLDASLDLIGFSVAEYDRFWIALLAWAHTALLVQTDRFYKHQELLLSTQVVPASVLIESIAAASGLSLSVVTAITDRLTYSPQRKRGNIYLHPFIVSNGIVAFSTLVVIMSRHQRNLLKAMAQTPELVDAAATLVGSRERPMLRRFAKLLEKRGWAYKLNQAIPGGEIDLLGYHPKHPSEVLIVQGKAVLSVDTVHEVDAATDQLLAAQDQAVRCKLIIKGMEPSDLRRLFKFVNWDLVRTYCLLVVAPEAEPNERYDHQSVPFISLDTAEVQLKHRAFRSPGTLVEVCRDRTWTKPIHDARETHSIVEIGSVSVELPAMEIAPTRG